jgi:hypothetical protein
MRRLFFIVTILLIPFKLIAATYNLEITAPQASLDTSSRWYKAYPGLEYKVPVGVFGGAYPFTYTLTTYPTGMTIHPTTGIITWSNPTTENSPHSVTVSVTDAESTTVTRSWTITVTTTGFIFVNASAGDGGDGTITTPFNSFADFYGAELHTNTYAGYFVYFRAGTYSLAGCAFYNTGQQYYCGYPASEKPHVWLAYPGESVTINHSADDVAGAFLNTSSWNGRADMYIGGITFTNGLNHFWRVYGARNTFYECTFSTWGPGVDGENSSALMWASSGGINGHYYPLVKDCTISEMISGTGNSFLKLYSTTKMVIEGNTMTTGSGAGEGIAIKAWCEYTDVRGNTIDTPQHAINGNFNICNHAWIRFNNIKNSNTTGGDGSTYGALTLNYNTSNCGTMYIERNTFEGNIIARELGTGDGPFHFKNNVIINENAGDVPAEGSHINCWSCTDASVLTIDSANLVGAAADGIIDTSGKLTGAYRSTYLGTKGHEIPSTIPSVTGCTISGASMQ